MSRKKKLLLIINPRSGRGRIRFKTLELLDMYSREGFQVSAYVTQRSLDARDIVLREGRGRELIVACGGDGTLNEVINGLAGLKKPARLGYIPAGTTNDFAASLRLPKTVLKAAEVTLHGRPFAVDIGSFCENRRFAYVAGFGAFTEVSYLTPQDKKSRLGHQAYMIEGVKSLSAIKPCSMRFSCAELAAEGDFVFGMMTNSVSVGGFKSLVGQKVVLDDGLFELLFIRIPRTPAEVSEVVQALLTKEEQYGPMVYRFHTAALDFESAAPVDWVLDGEFGGSRTAGQIRNLPGEAVILCPG